MKALLASTAVWTLLLSGCAAFDSNPEPLFHHVVLCWLKDAGNQDQQQTLISIGESFRNIPGVLGVQAGPSVESDRAIVDDSFDVAYHIWFKNREAMETYLVHPIHHKAKHEVLLPLVSKVVVYDFTSGDSK